VTGSSGVWVSFAAVVALYAALGFGTIMALRAMSRRWRGQDTADETAPYGPRPEIPAGTT
jgi:cytochrome d ubiquinol oxidase subunit I